MAGDLISKKTRSEFCEHFVSWTLRTIETEFDAADIARDEQYNPPTSGQRRALVEQYYHTLDFSNWADVRKLLVVYQNALAQLEEQARHPSPWDNGDWAQKRFSSLKKWIERDGFRYENRTLLPVGAVAPLEAVEDAVRNLDLPELLRQIARMRSSVDEDPALAIGTAKELVETTCKTILLERRVEFSPSADVGELVKKAREVLHLLPEDIPESAKGAQTIRKLLSNLGTIGQSLGELRNLYGSGHGRPGGARGLGPRHARLAVGSAATLTLFLFETHQERLPPSAGKTNEQ